ncbi:MAG: AMP-binding protein [Hyphomonadaceae bacterium]|nr:AMP-binding protein [Hyphomonadaceae bacterium]
MFVASNGTRICAGQIRATAAEFAGRFSGPGDGLYVYTSSAAEMCVALLVSALTGRDLILLPQAGQSFCAGIPSLTSGNWIGEIPGQGGELVMATHSEADADLSEIRDEAPIVSFYTSGSSGQPKIIEKPIGCLEAEANYWCDRFEGQFNWVCGSVSHQHIYGFLFRIAFPVLSCIEAADDTPLAWGHLLADTRTRGPALLVSSPAHLTRIAPEEIDDPSGVAAVLSSGGSLPFDAAHAVRDLFGHLPIEIFGSTETGGVAWRRQEQEGHAWTPLKGVRIAIGASGLLTVGSDFIPSDTPFEMGDLVEATPEGGFRHKGRADLIAKIEGKRVSLTRVRDTLAASPLVADAAVLVTSVEKRERLSAVIVPSAAGRERFARSGAFRFSRSLVSEASGMLEPAELPKRWCFLSEIPRNAQSKLSQEMLAHLFESPRMLELLSADIVRGQSMEAEVCFDAVPTLPWFAGHFPGQPILPGLSEVHIAVTVAEELWAVRPGTHSINRLKFNRVIQPGDRIVMQLSFDDAKKRLTFKLSTNGESVASGTIG